MSLWEGSGTSGSKEGGVNGNSGSSRAVAPPWSSPESAGRGQEGGAVVEGCLGLFHALLELLEGGRVEAVRRPLGGTLCQAVFGLDLAQGWLQVQRALVGAGTFVHGHWFTVDHSIYLIHGVPGGFRVTHFVGSRKGFNL